MPRQLPSSDAGVFLIGVFSCIFGLIILLFVLVTIPYVFFNATTTVPDFVLSFSNWLAERDNLEGFWHRVILVVPFLIASGLFFLISWYATLTLEKKDADLARARQRALATPLPETTEKTPAPSSYADFISGEKSAADKHPVLFIVSLILIVIGLLILAEYLIGADIL